MHVIIWETVKEEILKWLNQEIIYSISNSQCISSVHVVPKKAEVIVTVNDKTEDIQTCLQTKWQVDIEYQKLSIDNMHFIHKFI